MNFSELLQYRPALMAIFSEYGVTSPRIFGSTIHGLARDDSDIDFLISWPVQHSLIDRIRLKGELESVLNTRVDLVTDQTVHPIIREQVLREAKPL